MWREGQITDEDYPFDDISVHLGRPDCLVWVDLSDPNHARLQSLAEELALDPHAVEDAIASDERAKATGYEGYLFVSAYATTFDEDLKLRHHRVSAFVLDRALITVHGHGWEGMDEVVRRWDEDAAMICDAGVDALLHGLLDTVVDGQFETVQAIDAAIESFEDELFEARPHDGEQQRQVFDVRRASVQFRRLVVPMSQLVTTLHRVRGNKHRCMDSHWNDLYDHVQRIVEWSDSLRDQLNNVFAANMALQDARLNTVMKKLTAWAAIIAVPTAVTGFYGQNVPYPGFSARWGFWTSATILVSSMVALYVSFKRRRWL